LEELPRERLEREKITYLSAEQRLNYLVNIDKDGRLKWYVRASSPPLAIWEWTLTYTQVP
jgi:hypothetical protein